MSKCPYCKAEVNLEDFFEVETKVKKSGEIKKKIGKFKGQQQTLGVTFGDIKMWTCPFCDSILGFSEYRYSL